MNIPQPLVYFQTNSAFEIYRNNGYTEKQNDQAVFVGDTKKIYTHGEVFDCNNTVYNDTELRGLINGVDDKIDSSVQTLTGLIDGVSDDLDNINNWSESDIRTSINNMMSEANWINNFISTNNIQTGTPFTITDVDNRLKAVGVLNNDGTLGWSTLQQNYNTISGTVNSLSSRVSDLETGGVDEEALQARLEGYIDDEIAGLNLDTTYAKLDDTAIAWLRSGFSAQASPQLTFSQMYSAATKDWSGDITTATAGVKTEIENELDGYVATIDLATKVANAGFAQTSGVVAKSDLDSSVAALFSSTSSTKTALDNKGYLTSSDLNGYATEQYVNSAGFLTQTDLNSATATMVATSELDGKIETYLTQSQHTSGKWAAGVTSTVNTANSNASTALSTANNNATAITNLFATNGAGTAAVTAEVTSQLSNLTLRADKITLDGTTWANTIFADWISANGVKANELYTGSADVNQGWYTQILGNTIKLKWYQTKNGVSANHAIVLKGGSNSLDGGIYIGPESNPTVTITEDGFYGNVIGSVSMSSVSSGVTHEKYLNENGLRFTNSDFANDEDGSTEVVIDEDLIQVSLYSEQDGSCYTVMDGQGFSYSNSGKGDTVLSDQLSITTRDNTYKTLIGYNGISIEDRTNDVGTYIWPNLIISPQISQSSDRTLKDVVSDVNLTVEQVAEAPAVDFTWKNDQSENKQHNVGTIAQYWQVVLPEVVGETNDGKLTMQYGNAAMVSAIVTAKEVVALKEEIAELKRQIAELKNN